MKRKLLPAAVLSAFAFLLSAAEESASVPARLFSVRDGMPNLAAKLAAGKKVTIVFLGGSITQMGGSSGDGFVRAVPRILQTRYPKAAITVRNAGVGGSDSLEGAKRYDRDVLRWNPDAVFVEFAVNDRNFDRTIPMERIVHKTWRKDPRIDLVFFYTLDKSHLESYRAGNLPFAAACHEKVAAFYGIPSVGTAFHAAEKINSGTMRWQDFSGDTCHPKAAGYRLFAEAFALALPEFLRREQETTHCLGKSITENLEVYPPRLKPRTPAVPAAFRLPGGSMPEKVYPLPVPAVHWVGSASWSLPSGKVLWRIDRLPRKHAGTAEGASGVDRRLWENRPAEWFEEGRGFTGSDGNCLFSSDGTDAVQLGFSTPDVGVLSFIAPENGRYVFQVRSKAFDMWANDGKTVALSVLKFTSGRQHGELLALHRERKKDRKGVSLDAECVLAAGDAVAFLPDANVPGYIRGGWRGLRIIAAKRVDGGRAETLNGK